MKVLVSSSESFAGSNRAQRGIFWYFSYYLFTHSLHPTGTTVSQSAQMKCLKWFVAQVGASTHTYIHAHMNEHYRNIGVVVSANVATMRVSDGVRV